LEFLERSSKILKEIRQKAEVTNDVDLMKFFKEKEIVILYKLGSLFNRTRNFEKSKEVLEESLRKYEEMKEEERNIDDFFEIYFEFSSLYEGLNEFTKAIDYLEKLSDMSLRAELGVPCELKFQPKRKNRISNQIIKLHMFQKLHSKNSFFKYLPSMKIPEKLLIEYGIEEEYICNTESAFTLCVLFHDLNKVEEFMQKALKINLDNFGNNIIASFYRNFVILYA